MNNKTHDTMDTKTKKIDQALSQIENIIQPLIDEFGEDAISDHGHDAADRIYESETFQQLHFMYDVSIPDYRRKRLDLQSSLINASDEVLQRLHFVLNMGAVGDTDSGIQQQAAVLLGDVGEELLSRAQGYRNDINRIKGKADAVLPD